MQVTTYHLSNVRVGFVFHISFFFFLSVSVLAYMGRRSPSVDDDTNDVLPRSLRI